MEESPHIGVVISAEGHKEECVIDCTRSSLFLINDTDMCSLQVIPAV